MSMPPPSLSQKCLVMATISVRSIISIITSSVTWSKYPHSDPFSYPEKISARQWFNRYLQISIEWKTPGSWIGHYQSSRMKIIWKKLKQKHTFTFSLPICALVSLHSQSIFFGKSHHNVLWYCSGIQAFCVLTQLEMLVKYQSRRKRVSAFPRHENEHASTSIYFPNRVFGDRK